MKRTLKWFFCAMLLLSTALFAQKPASKLKEKFSYTFQQNDGTNASAVAWDPDNKVYVTVIAGNEAFPLEVFDGSGAAVSQNTGQFDWRGLWFNPNTGNLEGNGSGDFGWVSFSLQNGSQPTIPATIFDGQLQPDFNNVGSYDGERNEVVFWDLEQGSLVIYDREDAEEKRVVALVMKKTDVETLNTTTVAFTGHAGFDYAMLDFADGKLIFLNLEGEEIASSKFPKGAPLNEAFAFSFANGHAFLYDKDARTWHAYKVW